MFIKLAEHEICHAVTYTVQTSYVVYSFTTVFLGLFHAFDIEIDFQHVTRIS